MRLNIMQDKAMMPQPPRRQRDFIKVSSPGNGSNKTSCELQICTFELSFPPSDEGGAFCRRQKPEGEKSCLSA